MTPTYDELLQQFTDLKAKYADLLVASEVTARAEFLRGQEYYKNLPSPLTQGIVTT